MILIESRLKLALKKNSLNRSNETHYYSALLNKKH